MTKGAFNYSSRVTLNYNYNFNLSYEKNNTLGKLYINKRYNCSFEFSIP